MPRSDPNATNCADNTALHYAAWQGRTAAIEALLAAGAEPRARNSYGAIPLDITLRERHRDAAALLTNSHPDRSPSDPPSVSPPSVTATRSVNRRCSQATPRHQSRITTFVAGMIIGGGAVTPLPMQPCRVTAHEWLEFPRY